MDLDNVIVYGARILAFLIAIPFHEAAHAFVSYKLGDPTAKSMGRLTLNPVKHLDPIGFLAMLIVGIGWAKPVPIDTRYYKDRKKGMALSAAAGPLANLLLAVVFMLLFKVFGNLLILQVMNTGAAVGDLGYVVYNVLYLLASINVTLAIFNLLPVPPFDGSRIFLVFLPEKLYFAAMKYERIIMLGMLALVWFGFLDGVLYTANSGVMWAIDWATGWVDSLFRLAY